ncbi:MAG TPA: hypothetical protein VEJ20_04245, partial [Candidatus Eremiobacteraceae bacterium]|nr:hypothetical protein [Candidatus Eremiobacteraceae bacterium]
SASSIYQITRYTSSADSGLGTLPAAEINIASDGRTAASSFVPPNASLHTDASESLLWSIDSHGTIVGFAIF